MVQTLTLHANGALGSDVGTDGIGAIAGGILVAEDADFCYRKTLAHPVLCVMDDGGLYQNEDSAANNATADDVEIPVNAGTLATDDALYVGHATQTFGQVDIEVGVVGTFTSVVFAYEYWNGTAYTALSGVVDGTLNPGPFMSTVDTVVSFTFTIPTDWAKNTVDGVNAYWIRWRCTDATGGTTAGELDQLWIVTTAANAAYTDLTDALGEATANDVGVFQTGLRGKVGDQFILGHSSQKFAKIKFTVGTAAVDTQTCVWKYWNGSAWAAITTFEDKTAFFNTAAGAGQVLSFAPPSDWTITTAANGPNGQVGYFICLETTAFTSITTNALITEAFMYTLGHASAVGVRCPQAGSIASVDMYTREHLGTANDSKFLLVNATQATSSGAVTWTKTTLADQDACVLSVAQDDELVLLQIVEDGTTEIGATTQGADFVFRLNP